MCGDGKENYPNCFFLYASNSAYSSRIHNNLHHGRQSSQIEFNITFCLHASSHLKEIQLAQTRARECLLGDPWTLHCSVSSHMATAKRPKKAQLKIM